MQLVQQFSQDFINNAPLDSFFFIILFQILFIFQAAEFFLIEHKEHLWASSLSISGVKATGCTLVILCLCVRVFLPATYLLLSCMLHNTYSSVLS